MAASDSEMVTIHVDGREVEVPAGVMLVEATKAVDVEIPVFCYHPKLEPVGMCRMCLVEIGSPSRRRDGTPEMDEAGEPVIRWFPKLMTACTTPVTDGMRVKTVTDRVTDAWRGTLEFLLTSHPLDCPVCDKGGECPLQDLTFAYGPDLSRFYRRNKFHFEKPIPLGELIWLDRERCIYCARCVRFQEEVAADPVLKFADRNRGQEIVTYSDPPFDSYFSGNTTDLCPVGALTTEDFRFKARVWELTNVPSIDPYDCVGSNIVLGTRSDQIIRVMPRTNERVNEIWISDKTRFGHHFVRAEDRLTTPLVRENGALRPATWDEALERVANGLATISASHGAHTLGGIAGGRSGNEDHYLFAKLLRDLMGSQNLDARPGFPQESGIEAAVASVGLTSDGHLGALGKGDVLLLLGSDLEEEQPVLYLRARGAARRGTTLVVAGSRPTKEMSEDATVPLLVPHGGESSLMAALLRALLARGGADFGRLGGVDALREGIEALDPVTLAAEAGLDQTQIDALAATIAGAGALVILVGRAALAEATDGGRMLVDAASALLAASGRAGQPNSGLAALWPANNSQGAIDMGVLPHLAAGYQPVAEPGATAERMLSGEAGLRALYVMGADPAADQPSSRAMLEGLDLLVVQDLFLTATAELADVVLPAAAFAERDGTFTNFERRVQRFQKALEPIGDSLADWRILSRLAARLDAGWPDYFTAHDVAEEIAARVRPYKGFTYSELRGAPVGWTTTAAGHHIYNGTAVMNTWFGRQWPVAAEGRRPKFDLRWSGPPPAAAAREDGLRLIGRRVQYDRGTMISRSELLDARRARPVAWLHPDDAAALDLGPEAMVTLTAGERSATVPLVLEARSVAGCVVVPWGVDPDLDALLEEGRAVTVARATAAFA